MFTIGWTGEAAAASFTILLPQWSAHSWKRWSTYQTSCFWPATRFAGLKGSPLVIVIVAEKDLDMFLGGRN